MPKTWKKKTVCMLLAVLMVFALAPTAGLAAGEDALSTADIQLLVSDFVQSNINDNEDCTWNLDMTAKETPLYDTNDKVAAYYVALSNTGGKPNGYVVVNASPKNPAILEYAFDCGHEELAQNGKTYYGTMGMFLTRAQSNAKDGGVYLYHGQEIPAKEVSGQMESVWESMNKRNAKAQAVLKDLKAYAKQEPLKNDQDIAMPMDTSAEWGLLPSNAQLGKTLKASDALLKYPNVEPYAYMGEFSDPKYNSKYKNHCGATAALNILKYYGVRLNYNLIRPTKDKTMEYLYKNTGNGGLTLPTKLKAVVPSYIADRKKSGSIAQSVTVSTAVYGEKTTYLSNMKACVKNGKMPLMNIYHGGQSHWINIVEWRTYTNGITYVRVVDNWNKKANHYYIFQSDNTVNALIGAMISVKITK